MSAISVRDVRKSFGTVEVLRGVDLDVAPGSVFALLGSNGAGKTTLVRILATRLRAAAGEATGEGFDVATQGAAGGTTALRTTQYLDEAEHLADHIAILHGGRIIAHGTLEELKRLLPPAKVEYVEKQPTLEEIFLAIIGTPEEAA